MNSHLSEEQIAELVGGQAGTDPEGHARECPECAAEVARTQRALLLFRESAHGSAGVLASPAPIQAHASHARPCGRRRRRSGTGGVLYRSSGAGPETSPSSRSLTSCRLLPTSARRSFAWMCPSRR